MLREVSESWQAKLARCFREASEGPETVPGFHSTDFLGLTTRWVSGATTKRVGEGLEIYCRNYLTGKLVAIARVHPLAVIKTVGAVLAEIERLRRVARMKKPAGSTQARISCERYG